MTKEELDFLEKIIKIDNCVLVIELKNISKFYVIKTNIAVINYLYNKYNDEVVWKFITRSYKLRICYKNLNSALQEASKYDFIYGIQRIGLYLENEQIH